MAAIVTGLIPILRTAVDSTATYKGRTMWFGLLCIRLVTIFLAQFPWKSLNDDFICNNSSQFCIKACFNEHFDRSIVMAWHFLFILLVLSVLLMELFSSHLRSSFQKKKEREMESESEQGGVIDPTMTVGGRLMIDLHKSKSSLVVYLFSLMLRIVVEVMFVYVLLFWVLPKLDKSVYFCELSFKGCSVQQCVVRGAAEKTMSVYALLFISALVIITSSGFFFYSIVHYL
ncbi:Gap junction beta-5 protein [Anabarilius grahami]|uniref:Gap junction beta-5 protein n=1 Tax=Anabarilius grahami TaxID=495550 RepID=A0A3N0XQ01_ANAGA|nr:Gap junction beta-5 protein [Anabarilius grahami]